MTDLTSWKHFQQPGEIPKTEFEIMTKIVQDLSTPEDTPQGEQRICQEDDMLQLQQAAEHSPQSKHKGVGGRD